MQRYEADRPSAAWATVSDVPAPPEAPAHPLAAEAIANLLPARRRVAEAVTAAMAELAPASALITVTINAPDGPELARARAWLDEGELAADEVGRRLGQPVTEADLVGWVSEWPLTARGSDLVGTHPVLPATEPAELSVHIADWLQDFLADVGISDPVPPCPGHAHPMQLDVRHGQPWWLCPRGEPIRAWRAATG
ncbi:hypothetical protein [Frankia sp. AgB32]|uniref:hypothetical protein n=1 Tax=Frankia sp. AgB32 TaxID=631119 RepID=UPI00200C4F72|nr:hypothetical protein [Frankia sp. AgB32]MCK9893628.1 hypothetical protein [Frankia sp. AgB32]